jgi:cytochrome c oxidase cbb3-type subunit 3
MKKKLKFLTGIISLSLPAFAQEAKVVQPIKIPEYIFNPEFYVILCVGLIVIFSFITLLRVIKVLTGVLTNKQVEEYISASVTEELTLPKESWISVMWKKLTDAKPVEQERDILLDHDYDGIKELDNNLPPWWKYGFYISILFSVGYMFHYHVLGTGKLQIAEYNDEMEKARIELEEYRLLAANNIDETNVVILSDAAELIKGGEIYIQYCSACHGTGGEGNVGPNLTDDYWIHGADIKDIFKVIKDGVPQKGMISWKQQLSPKQIQEVSSYIKSIVGTNPPNAKEPQGEKFADADLNKNQQVTANK